MYANYTCEQCFNEYDDESKFVQCRGDACHETVCKNCAQKCKNPECSRWVCDQCRKYSSSKEYCGDYCIDCAMWSTNKDDDWKNFDFVKRGMTHKEGLDFLKKYPSGRKTKHAQTT